MIRCVWLIFACALFPVASLAKDKEATALAVSQPSARYDMDRLNRVAIVLGLDGSTGYGVPRAGPNASLLFARCVDACGGLGPTVGLYNFERREYYLGVGGGAAYMGSVWMEAAARVSKGKASGFHATWGFGLGLMLYVELGVDLIQKIPNGKIGMTIKWPIYGWKI